MANQKSNMEIWKGFVIIMYFTVYAYFTTKITRSNNGRGKKSKVQEPRGQWLEVQAEKVNIILLSLICDEEIEFFKQNNKIWFIKKPKGVLYSGQKETPNCVFPYFK